MEIEFDRSSLAPNPVKPKRYERWITLEQSHMYVVSEVILRLLGKLLSQRSRCGCLVRSYQEICVHLKK